ncbi:UvrD-helicase domain-containing protein, partial [bacterium]|nr:UvrD-helicase domain-containing protein [bacterium]
MSIENLLSELNQSQFQAACMPSKHALILAGAGTGKTKTIVARAAYLISIGVPAG